jgi:hypothetical protein
MNMKKRKPQPSILKPSGISAASSAPLKPGSTLPTGTIKTISQHLPPSILAAEQLLARWAVKILIAGRKKNDE